MTKLLTLRNIFALFTMLLFVACNKNEGIFENSNTIEVKSFSSEDNSIFATTIGEIKDPETGRVICIIKQK
jgi:uncharacterized lipoprotein YajG